MNFLSQDLPGVFLIKNFVANDIRGVFVKTFHAESFKEAGFSDQFRESYYSISKKNVLRGMHFQIPPHEHYKLVYVTKGKILDVVLDIRKASPSFGKSISFELSEAGGSVLIPKGCAHGFMALSDEATVVYNVTSVYNGEADKGIKWNSFGFDWPVGEPVISERDNNFVAFSDFISPF